MIKERKLVIQKIQKNGSHMHTVDLAALLGKLENHILKSHIIEKLNSFSWVFSLITKTSYLYISLEVTGAGEEALPPVKRTL